MPQNLCIISCTAHKRSIGTAAEQLYSSELFLKSRRYAQANFDRWLILSAKHGIVEPGTQLDPYDQSLTSLTRDQRRELAKKIKTQIQTLFPSRPSITSICGQEYDSLLEDAGIPFERPSEFAVSIGRKLHALARCTDPQRSEKLLDSVYRIVRRLAVARGLNTLASAPEYGIPKSGVYLFFDAQERRLRDPTQLRIVRIGTHGIASGSKASLRHRIRTHLGTSSGEGNHRSSIFRLHVGRSLISGGHVGQVATWGAATRPPEQHSRNAESTLEHVVSEYLSKLFVLFVEVPGDAEKTNDRAYLEQNLIALLANRLKPLDPPSHRWLGLSSDKEEIRKSGLWNVNHTKQLFDPEFISVLKYYVDVALGKQPIRVGQVAPKGWLSLRHRHGDQLTLL